ncbi:MAG: hypothetical protein ACI955_002203 [Zhongshania sp.]|jgi:hypothetical protein
MARVVAMILVYLRFIGKHQLLLSMVREKKA